LIQFEGVLGFWGFGVLGFWGFDVAKRLTGPIEELLKGTEQVAQGNLNYQIPSSGKDELHRLINSFNLMTRDLLLNKSQIETNTTYLEKINAELNHRRKYIEVLLESLHSGVISLDENGRVTMLNSAALKLLNLENSEVIGKSYKVIVPESHREDFKELLSLVSQSSEVVRQEIRIQKYGGEWITLLITLSSLTDENKKDIGVVGVFEDVTEIQKMERMIAWREVAKRIAHEIKNPLTPIQLSVERLRRRYLDKIVDDGTFGQATKIILNEVSAIKALVNEFSLFARLPEIRPSPDNLNEVVLETVNLFRAAHEKIMFQLELSEEIPVLELDRAQLKRALINLFDNAVAAMLGQGQIEVITEWDEKRRAVRLTVADEGCGIPESVYSQLFEPYFSTKQGGTGLGLAIVQRILTDHGGYIRVSANSPRGTRFLIEFPERTGLSYSGMGSPPLMRGTRRDLDGS
jgi:two-component system nitrogen regulation sensor histidine kinase NtrY